MQITGDIRVFHMENGMKIKVKTVFLLLRCG